MDTNKIKGILLIAITAIIMLAGSYFFGYSNGVKNKPINSPIVVMSDTTKKVKVDIKPSIDIEETAPEGTVKYKYRTIYIPVGVDSSVVDGLIKQNDSLLSALGSMQVRRTSVLDTLIGDLKDTVRIAHEVIQDYWKIHVGISPRLVDVKSEIKTIYIDPPPRQWWDNPLVIGGAGTVLGVIIKACIK